MHSLYRIHVMKVKWGCSTVSSLKPMNSDDPVRECQHRKLAVIDLYLFIIINIQDNKITY
jgi:hypothetical protein